MNTASQYEAKLKNTCCRLAQHTCACCTDGENCVLTDSPCKETLLNDSYTISDGAIDCDWFMTAVLPADPELYRKIMARIRAERALGDDTKPISGPQPNLSFRRCVDCGEEFLPNNNRHKRCKACARKEHKRLDNKWHRAQYWG